MRLSARGYHRVLRVARTLADLDAAERIGRVHLAEALSYRALADDVRGVSAESRSLTSHLPCSRERPPNSQAGIKLQDSGRQMAIIEGTGACGHVGPDDPGSHASQLTIVGRTCQNRATRSGGDTALHGSFGRRGHRSGRRFYRRRPITKCGC